LPYAFSSSYASSVSLSLFLFLYSSRDHRDLHSFPTRRSSDLRRRLRIRPCRPRPNSRGRGRASPPRPASSPTFRVRVRGGLARPDRKSTRLNSSHVSISYAVFCLKKKKKKSK